MKNTIYILSALFLTFLISCGGNPEPTKVEGDKAFFGAEISLDNPITVSELLNKMNGQDSLTDVLVSGEIVETCAVKGCWMTITNKGGEDMRVRFKDYGFFVPTEGVEGKETMFRGTAFKDMISVDMQKHYIDDSDMTAEEKEAEKAKITEDKPVISFMADGVVITGVVAENK